MSHKSSKTNNKLYQNDEEAKMFREGKDLFMIQNKWACIAVMEWAY